MHDDASAYRRYLDGDERGFDEIIHTYHDRLIYFIYQYVKHFEDAEDLAAETFMELMVHKRRFDFRSSFKTYLFAIARHKAIDHIRREKRRPRVSLEEMDREQADLICVEKTIITSQTLEEVKKVISKLSPDYATYLHLTLFEELENEEIATIMKKTKKQMANISFRAKNALREALGREDAP